MLAPGHSVGPYRIDREIGRGGMGVVYLARDTRLDRMVAIKALPEHLLADPDRLARFEREAKIVASLHHPGIAAVHAGARCGREVPRHGVCRGRDACRASEARADPARRCATDGRSDR